MTLAADNTNKNKKTTKVPGGVTPEISAENTQNVETITSNPPAVPKPADQKPAEITSQEVARVSEVSEIAKTDLNVAAPASEAAPISVAKDASTTVVAEASQTESAVSSLPPSDEALKKAIDNNPAELESLISRDNSALSDLGEVMDQGMQNAMGQKDQGNTPSALPTSADEEK